MKSVLVIFGKNPPRKSKKWLRQFKEVVCRKSLWEKMGTDAISFVDIETLVSPGSVQNACKFVNEISQLTFPDGSLVSKSVDYRGYELWWTNYDSIYRNFCLPYTQYQNLLFYLKDNFDRIYLYQPPYSDLFKYFLKAQNREYAVFSKFRLRNLLPVPFGIFLQIFLSILFLLWLRIVRPWLLVRTGDKLVASGDYDLRMKFIYEELRIKKISFVEFVRSLEPWHIVLRHVWQRKRPVVYSTAIIFFVRSLANLLRGRKRRELAGSFSSSSPERDFSFLIATHYLYDIKGVIWSVEVMRFIWQWIGIKSAIIFSGTERVFCELIGCKLAGIKTAGIQHGLTPRYYPVSEFMPNFDGKFPLSVDKYGLWSNWWREYYLAYSRAFRPEQLYVSGPMRPLERRRAAMNKKRDDREKVLFISEQLSYPTEILPYVSSIIGQKDFMIFFKFRSYSDGFELWLKENRPDIYERILKDAVILRGSMEEAIERCDIVIGSHSTAVLEALLQLKPFILFWTNKWGDYYDIKSFNGHGRFFANNPEELINCIRKSADIPQEDLIKLQEQFFGDPYKNGSKWVVEQAVEFAKNYGK